MTPLVHARRVLRRLRWHAETDTLPPVLRWLARHRHEAGALLALGLFSFACAALATAVAVSDEQVFTGWGLLAVLVGAAFAAAAIGHMLVDLAGAAGGWLARTLRRRSV